MNVKILVGLLAILGLFGMSFASDGAVPGYEKHRPEALEECKAYFTSEEVTALRAEAKDAMESGDVETASEIRQEIMDGAPEECKKLKRFKHPEGPKKPFHQLPEGFLRQVIGAFLKGDFETLKQLHDELLSKGILPELPENPPAE